MTEEIIIILPPAAESEIDIDLVNLTQLICEKHNLEGGYGLGGKYGYGADFKNEVFCMWPYYWGECTCGYGEREEAHQAAIQATKTKYDQVEAFLSDGHEDDCPTIRPNFEHFESGLAIDWYKWIGRSTELNREVSAEEWRKIIAECRASV